MRIYLHLWFHLGLLSNALIYSGLVMSNDWSTINLLSPSSYMDILNSMTFSFITHRQQAMYLFFNATAALFYVLPHFFMFIWINLAARRIHAQYIA
jgi:hypothetical protein